jgi:hypothetical protein
MNLEESVIPRITSRTPDLTFPYFTLHTYSNYVLFLESTLIHLSLAELSIFVAAETWLSSSRLAMDAWLRLHYCGFQASCYNLYIQFPSIMQLFYFIIWPPNTCFGQRWSSSGVPLCQSCCTALNVQSMRVFEHFVIKMFPPHSKVIRYVADVNVHSFKISFKCVKILIYKIPIPPRKGRRRRLSAIFCFSCLQISGFPFLLVFTGFLLRCLRFCPSLSRCFHSLCVVLSSRVRKRRVTSSGGSLEDFISDWIQGMSAASQFRLL